MSLKKTGRSITQAVQYKHEKRKKALPEIVWVLGRTSVVPKEIPSFVRRGVGR